ncbi:MAG: hypothetical protein MI922_19850, partial [Bacteroidales bacterium]|nr:hypothetical protein [Bacteroidales bacterium]
AMKLKALILLAAITTFGAIISAQENETFTPSGTGTGKVFFNFHSNFEEDETVSSFELKRVYLGYKYNFTEHLSTNITLDVGKSDVKVPVNDSTTVKATTSLNYTAYVKRAMLTYNKDKLTLDIGLIGNKQFKAVERKWTRRYIEKTYQDKYKLGPSADFGICANYQVLDMLSVDLTVRNGEGYKTYDYDNVLVTGLGYHIEPLDGLMIRGYYDYSEAEEVQFTYSHFIGYNNDKISAGVEYSVQNNHKYENGNQIGGLSAFAGFKITDKIEVFGRYDYMKTEKDSENSISDLKYDDGSGIIAGVQYNVARKVHVALNYQGFMYQEDIEGVDNDNSVYVNFQYAF